MVASCKAIMRLMRRNVVPYFRCGSRKQSGRTPSSTSRYSTPFDPMIAVLTAPERIRTPTSTTNAWKASLRPKGPARNIEIRYQIVKVLTALATWDDHHGEERYQRRGQHAKDENYQTSPFELAQLGGSDLPVDLRQALLTAHCEQRMSLSDEDGHDGNSRSPSAF